MEQALASSGLVDLNAKLDALSAQVQYLTEQAQQAERKQQTRTELMHDVLPIANDAVELVTTQLEEIQAYVDLSDLLRLVKRLLRNGRNIDRLLDRLESFIDLAQTMGPLGDNMLEKATDVLQAAEQRGYFALARGGAQSIDKVASSLSAEDVDRLAENIVVVLEAFKGLSDPVDRTSTRSLMAQLRDPDTRRGLAAVLHMLNIIGKRTAEASSTDNPRP
jgi:uncharacterized protein YjgD (DUF1641 family)